VVESVEIWGGTRFQIELAESVDSWESLRWMEPFDSDFNFGNTNWLGESEPNEPSTARARAVTSATNLWLLDRHIALLKNRKMRKYFAFSR
jgi:hypothetical protein